MVAVTSRRLQKRGSAVLCFDITDRTNSIRISRFLRSEDDQSIIDIVLEEAAAYFAGQKSAQDVAKLIQSKANIYINEQR